MNPLRSYCYTDRSGATGTVSCMCYISDPESIIPQSFVVCFAGSLNTRRHAYNCPHQVCKGSRVSLITRGEWLHLLEELFRNSAVTHSDRAESSFTHASRHQNQFRAHKHALSRTYARRTAASARRNPDITDFLVTLSQRNLASKKPCHELDESENWEETRSKNV